LFFLLDEYEWKNDACLLPPDEELVIYEIHVGDFSGGGDGTNSRGTFKNVLNKIDYLKELGVNASMLLNLFVFFNKNNRIYYFSWTYAN